MNCIFLLLGRSLALLLSRSIIILKFNFIESAQIISARSLHPRAHYSFSSSSLSPQRYPETFKYSVIHLVHLDKIVQSRHPPIQRATSTKQSRCPTAPCLAITTLPMVFVSVGSRLENMLVRELHGSDVDNSILSCHGSMFITFIAPTRFGYSLGISRRNGMLRPNARMLTPIPSSLLA